MFFRQQGVRYRLDCPLEGGRYRLGNTTLEKGRSAMNPPRVSTEDESIIGSIRVRNTAPHSQFAYLPFLIHRLFCRFAVRVMAVTHPPWCGGVDLHSKITIRDWCLSKHLLDVLDNAICSDLQRHFRYYRTGWANDPFPGQAIYKTASLPVRIETSAAALAGITVDMEDPDT